MHSISELVKYIFLFTALYFEVFLLITYFEYRGKGSSTAKRPKKLPSVTIMVPCWNEEKTIKATIYSLLELNYPEEKLSIFIIDDGSTDNTREVINREFAHNQRLRLLYKENGGKHSALNYGLEFVESELVGCLDADSFVDREALLRIVEKFSDKEVMAVTPSIKVHQPKNLIEKIQSVEYSWGILFRNLLSRIGALYVTPGPFSIFRKSVFERLGGYKEAHKTEDMEMALRIHNGKYKIENAPDAFVYTVAPKNIKALYKQRLRWTYGFLRNSIDYKHMLFNPEYGNLGVAVLPAAGFSLISSLYLILVELFDFSREFWHKFVEIQTVGLHFNMPKFDWFFLNTEPLAILSILGLMGTCSLIIFGRKMAKDETIIIKDILYFLIIYPILAPLWISKAIYNLATAEEISWR